MSDDLKAYFREAVSWDIDRTAQTIQRTRIAWIMAGAGWACAVAASVALALMMPLKTVEPYVIRVDNSTGIVDIVPMYAGRAEIGETVARFLLTHYVTVCEGFSYATAERDYEECGAYHTAKRNQEWYNLWNQTNPASPLNLNKDGSVVRVQVTAVTFFRKANGLSELAQVRYLKGRRPPGATEQVTHWVAMIEYAWVTPSRDPKSRQWNPLGWRVTDFRTEPESLADTSTCRLPTVKRKSHESSSIVCGLLDLPSLCGTSASAIAQMQVSAHADHRIRSMLYVPDQVVRLRGWVGYHVDLEFEPGESFVTLGGGDLAGLTYGAYGNHLVLKPKASDRAHESHRLHQQAHLRDRLRGVRGQARSCSRTSSSIRCGLAIHPSSSQRPLSKSRRI